MSEWLKTFWMRHVAQEAPVELARCEFDCRVTQCRHGKWRTCENRILHAEREVVHAKADGRLRAGKPNLRSAL